MRLAVFGASGRTGRLVVRQASQAGHHLTAATRRPQNVSFGDEIRVVAADITHRDMVDHAVAGCDAVLSTVATPYSRSPIDMLSKGAANLVAAMRRHSIPRLVVVSSAMVDPDWRPSGAFFFNRIVDPFILRKLGRTLYADIQEMESVIARSDLDWTIIRPSGLFDARSVTKYALEAESADGQYTGRPDLAAAMLHQLTHDRFIHKTVGVITTEITPNPLQLMSLWGEAFRR